MKKIIAFSGSNSANSINQSLIRATTKLSDKAEFQVLDLRDYPAPMYGVDEEGANGIPSKIQDLHSAMKAADGLIISTPEHNGATPAFFKNTIDWLSRIDAKLYLNKPVVFLSTSPGGRGGMTALSYFTNSAPHQGAEVIGSHSIGSFHNHVNNDQFVEGDEKKAVQELVEALINH